jgi:hypothetical protein
MALHAVSQIQRLIVEVDGELMTLICGIRILLGHSSMPQYSTQRLPIILSVCCKKHFFLTSEILEHIPLDFIKEYPTGYWMRLNSNASTEALSDGWK